MVTKRALLGGTRRWWWHHFRFRHVRRLHVLHLLHMHFLLVLLVLIIGNNLNSGNLPEGVFEDEGAGSTFTEAGSIDDATWACENSPAVLSTTSTVGDRAAAAPMDEGSVSSDAPSVMDSVMVTGAQPDVAGGC